MTNPGSSIGEPRTEFFVRKNPNDLDLVGPLTFQHANAQARFLSKSEDNETGVAEVITFVGARPGDALKSPPTTFVVFLYVRGRLTMGGRVAAFNSKKFLGL